MRSELYKERTIAAFAGLLAGTRKPSPPAGSDLIFNIFRALSASRSHSHGMPNPITFSEIEAYCRLYGWPLQPRHIDLILALDQVWLKRVWTPEGAVTSPQLVRRSASQAMTPAAFDAVFG